MKQIVTIFIGCCLLANCISLARSYPHLIAYFNEMAGGPQNGFKHLAFSCVDWGQDLLRVKGWMSAKGLSANNIGFQSYTRYPAASLVSPESGQRSTRMYEIVSANLVCDPSSAFFIHHHPKNTERIGFTLWAVPCSY